MKGHIEDVWVSDSVRENIDKLILIGESAQDKEFVDVVKEKIGGLQHGEMPEVLVEDPVFSASKGAAQIHLRDCYERLGTERLSGDDQAGSSLLIQGDP